LHLVAMQLARSSMSVGFYLVARARCLALDRAIHFYALLDCIWCARARRVLVAAVALLLIARNSIQLWWCEIFLFFGARDGWLVGALRSITRAIHFACIWCVW
jgi:hypothetical protein